MTQLGLHWDDDQSAKHHFTLDPAQTYTIGRGEDCDIVLADKLVSRKHASISVNDGNRMTLANLSKTNAVHLRDNEKLSQGETITLTPGLVFRVGSVWFSVHNEAGGHIVECPGCHQQVDSSLKNCNLCGMSLAGGLTIVDWEGTD
ncbi:MAG: FHA domain-containing protein [Chloroflexota bacterium]